MIKMFRDCLADKLKKSYNEIDVDWYMTRVFKYDPGQPRDRRGRWTDGGSVNGTDSIERGLIRTERSMANGLRRSPFHELSPSEIHGLKRDINEIGADESVFIFNEGPQTGYVDGSNVIFVRGDVLPDAQSTLPRDCMSARAVLAHEYFGHYKFAPSSFPIGDWRDEFRASYVAAVQAANLTDADRALLMIDAYSRASEAGVNIPYSSKARRIIYGYYET